jgi:hypothetical protein
VPTRLRDGGSRRRLPGERKWRWLSMPTSFALTGIEGVGPEAGSGARAMTLEVESSVPGLALTHAGVLRCHRVQISLMAAGFVSTEQGSKCAGRPGCGRSRPSRCLLVHLGAIAQVIDEFMISEASARSGMS